MKKRKGFTLVELLAVIAILAVLVIIALPNVMGMFKTAKKNSFETEVKHIYKVAEQQWMNDSTFSTDEVIYARVKNETCTKSLQLSGRNEINYYIKIDKSGKVIEYYTEDGTYQYSYSGPGLKIEDIGNALEISDIDSSNVLSISCTGATLGNNDNPGGNDDPSGGDEPETPVNIADVIGEYVNYDAITGVDDSLLSYRSESTSNGYNVQTFNVDKITPMKWKIYGTETVNGVEHILIIAADPITKTTTTDGVNTTSYYILTLRGTQGYINGPGEMNKICGLYGQGQYADTTRYTYYVNGNTVHSGGRNLIVEDINTVQSYNPGTPSQHIYKKKNDGYIYYGTGSGTKTNYTKYMFYNDGFDTTRSVGVFNLATGGSVTVPKTSYSYTLKTNTEIQKLVRYKDDGTNASYWLASRAMNCITSAAVGLNTHFEMRYVFSGSMGGATLFYSTGTAETFGNRGIRPIVSLDSNVYLSKKVNDVWILKSH